MKFEEQIARLEEIINQFDEQDITLDASLALYEEGIGLIRSCNERLEAAKLKVEQINKK